MIKDQFADQLVYSTVRIVCKNALTVSRGTGFFMYQDSPEGDNISAIVTNKHVVEGYNYAEITLAGVDAKGMPDDQNYITIVINDLQKKIIHHPNKDIDICLLFVNSEIKASKELGKPVYYRAIGAEMTLFPKDLDSLTSIEDIIMIGYPNGIIDEYNNKPVVRKGITATSLKLNYNGKPDFMVDVACFYGSSGSPVFLRKEGLEKETSENKITLGLSYSYSLLGIIHSMSIAKANGEIVVKEIPTAAKPIVETTIPLNLGQVTKAEKILELFNLVRRIKKANPSK